MNVHYITFRASVQATESDGRVKTALSLFLFDNEINETKTEGHFGNPITLLQGQIKGKECTRSIDLIKSGLLELELIRLRNERCERIDDECCLHIRFDKQAALEGKVRLAKTTDSISAKIKLKAYPAHYEKALEAADMLF
jgi:RNA binding exosome subunit